MTAKQHKNSRVINLLIKLIVSHRRCRFLPFHNPTRYSNLPSLRSVYLNLRFSAVTKWKNKNCYSFSLCMLRWVLGEDHSSSSSSSSIVKIDPRITHTPSAILCTKRIIKRMNYCFQWLNSGRFCLTRSCIMWPLFSACALPCELISSSSQLSTLNLCVFHALLWCLPKIAHTLSLNLGLIPRTIFIS